MEDQKIMNLLDNTTNQPFKFGTRYWVEIDNESRGTYNVSNQIKFKTSIVRSSLWDYSDANVYVKGAITVSTTETALAPDNRNNKKKIKNCASFINYISEISNTQLDDPNEIDVVTPTYNLIECSDAYSETSGSLLQ